MWERLEGEDMGGAGEKKEKGKIMYFILINDAFYFK